MADRKKKKFSIFKLLLFVIILFGLFYVVSSFLNVPGSEPAPQNNTANQTPASTNDGKDFYQSYPTGTTYSGNWKLTSNVGTLNNSVASGVRGKRTQILGNNRDVVTIMVYMCGSDLESQAAMGVYDLEEMANASISSNVNLLVYTGGTTKWHFSEISNRYNQIYKVTGNGSIERLVDNAGNATMVDPNTLVSFIEWCADNYEANRYELILWDHGGGSVSGYGYDEKNPNAGSMSLAQIDQALTEADVTFDFIGFDACLMANTETALMLAEHADYLIASEESEPGIGWYYTDWLNALSKNTSMSTLEIGKTIADSFVRMCRAKTPGQSATLSVIDLAEVEDIIPDKLSAFATSTNYLINNDGYRKVASARSGAREFASDSYVDLVDLIDMANNINTEESIDLAKALLSCVKYNNTSSDMSNSYGLSIYFPYRSTRYVSSVLNTYNKIDMDAAYSDCVRNFASYQTAGQVSSGGSHSAYQSFSGYDSSSYYSSQDSADLLYSVLDLFLSGSYGSDSSYSSYYGSGLDLLFGRGIDRNVAEYVAANHFDADLTWKDGKITLTDEQWSMVDSLRLNLFIDDGEGYIDLGKDNYFEIDADGSLLRVDDLTWLAASIDQKNWQVIPYYCIYQITDGDDVTSIGRVPVLLNGSYANLIVTIDKDGIAEVTGACFDYHDGSEIVAKNLVALGKDEKTEKEYDEIVFVCDYYDYDGTFSDTHALGEMLKVTDQLYIGDVDISGYDTLASYEFKDLYQQSYWTTPME